MFNYMYVCTVHFSLFATVVPLYRTKTIRKTKLRRLLHWFLTSGLVAKLRTPQRHVGSQEITDKIEGKYLIVKFSN